MLLGAAVMMQSSDIGRNFASVGLRWLDWRRLSIRSWELSLVFISVSCCSGSVLLLLSSLALLLTSHLLCRRFVWSDQIDFLLTCAQVDRLACHCHRIVSSVRMISRRVTLVKVLVERLETEDPRRQAPGSFVNCSVASASNVRHWTPVKQDNLLLVSWRAAIEVLTTCMIKID